VENNEVPNTNTPEFRNGISAWDEDERPRYDNDGNVCYEFVVVVMEIDLWCGCVLFVIIIIIIIIIIITAIIITNHHYYLNFIGI
jgi:hypothetical protein